MVAKVVLTGRLSAVVLLSGALLGCGPVLGRYPTEEPGRIGGLVDRLRAEAGAGLRAYQAEDDGTQSRGCGEDWQDKRTVAPRAGDRWRVNTNFYTFEAYLEFPVKSYQDAERFYPAYAGYLRGAGWSVTVDNQNRGKPVGLDAFKQGVDLDSFHIPDKDTGGQVVLVQLKTECYRHPNA